MKRARRKAEVAALSKIGLPVLWPMLASVTLPSAPTETTMVPLPVTLERRASYGYSIRGLEIMAAFPVGTGPFGAFETGRWIGATGLLLGVRLGCGVFSSRNSGGAASGIASGGGGGGGSSSGGGGGASCCCGSGGKTTGFGQELRAFGGGSFW